MMVCVEGKLANSSNSYPTNTPRGIHVETTWKRPFPRRFNVEATWCVSMVHTSLSCSRRKNCTSDLKEAVEMQRKACAWMLLSCAISQEFWYELYRHCSEIHSHNCLCESRGFKIERSSRRRCSIKHRSVRNYGKLTEKNLCQALRVQLYS